MHAYPDAGVAVNTLERVPLDLLLLRVDLDGSRWTYTFTVLTLVTFLHIESELSSYAGDWLVFLKWIPHGGWFSQQIL